MNKVKILLSLSCGLMVTSSQAMGQGCPRAHCDGGNTDFADIAAPTATPAPSIKWFRQGLEGEKAGSLQGLGCSANGTFAVCSYSAATGPGTPTDDNVVAYNYNGSIKWQSFDVLNGTAFASAPLILGSGASASTIAVDNNRVVKFDEFGAAEYNLLHGEGLPISPVIATRDGGIALIDDVAEAVVANLTIKDDPMAAPFFETQNTVAVKGNRIYVTLQENDGTGALTGDARFAAIDVDPTATNPADRLVVAWEFGITESFTSNGVGSLSSPLLLNVAGDDILYFDGYREVGGNDEPHIFAVRDDGTSYTEMFAEELDNPAFASFARDPAGGFFWHNQQNSLRIFKRSVVTGVVVGSINVNTLLGEPAIHRPTAAITFAGTTSDPKLITAARGIAPNIDPFLFQVDVDISGMNNHTLEWKQALPNTTPPGVWFRQASFL